MTPKTAFCTVTKLRITAGQSVIGGSFEACVTLAKKRPKIVKHVRFTSQNWVKM